MQMEGVSYATRVIPIAGQATTAKVGPCILFSL